MIVKTELSKAITLAIAGGALSMAAMSNASASTTYYNTFNAYGSNIISDEACLVSGDSCGSATDGWRKGAGSAPNAGIWTTTSGWTSSSAPFSTVAKVINWAAEITNTGDSLTISSLDSFTRYGIWADIDTAKGAWSDGTTGWGHNTDVGLFKSAVTQDVTIKISSIQLPGSPETWTNFGVSIFTGMAANNWSHHGTWNNPGAGKPFNANNPLGGGTTAGQPNLLYLIHDATVDAINGITFTAQAGQVYSILLGGNSGGTNYDPHAGYSVSLTTVPVPGAVWLFGSALAGFGSVSRRKSKVV
jgi:hypothetical protein